MTVGSTAPCFVIACATYCKTEYSGIRRSIQFNKHSSFPATEIDNIHKYKYARTQIRTSINTTNTQHTHTHTHKYKYKYQYQYQYQYKYKYKYAPVNDGVDVRTRWCQLDGILLQAQDALCLKAQQRLARGQPSLQERRVVAWKAALWERPVQTLWNPGEFLGPLAPGQHDDADFAVENGFHTGIMPAWIETMMMTSQLNCPTHSYSTLPGGTGIDNIENCNTNLSVVQLYNYCMYIIDIVAW